MSIYATYRVLKFENLDGWTEEVIMQGVPGHIGHTDYYPSGDPYADFLPPALSHMPIGDAENSLRAMVIVSESTKKGTRRNAQEYRNPLLVLSGYDYYRMPGEELLSRIEAALEGSEYDPAVLRKSPPPFGTSPPRGGESGDRT